MKHCESGRSLVEMLGTLAIMGLIGITGLQGFTYAMKRHRANELLNEANKRAIMVATDLMTGKKPEDISITGFPENSYGTFKAKIEPEGNDKFKMTVAGLEEGTCELLDSLAGGPIRRINCKEESSAEIFFNNDLSTEERASDYNTPETCQPPFKWCSGLGIAGQCSNKTDCCVGITYDNICYDCDSETGKLTDNYDSTCQTCADGEITNNYNLCQTCENGVISDKNNQCQECDSRTGIVTNIPDSPVTSCTITTTNDGICQSGECKENIAGKTCYYADNRDCGGQNSDYFCWFYDDVDFISDLSEPMKPKTGDGTCESVGTNAPTNTAGHVYLRFGLDWWSANAWCVAKGSTGLLTCDETGTSYSCTKNDVSSDVSGLQTSEYWLKNLPGDNFSRAFRVVVVNGSAAYVDDYQRSSSAYPLCE